MERKGAFFILLLIIAVLTLTLAILAGYLFISGSASNNGNSIVHQPIVPTPDVKDLGFKPIFEESQYFNLKIQPNGKQAIIEIKAELVYFKKAKVKDLEMKIDSHMGEIRELISTYFMNLTLDEVKKPETVQKVKQELSSQINDLLNSGEREKKDIIWTINFDRWFYAM